MVIIIIIKKLLQELDEPEVNNAKGKKGEKKEN